ncbi:MAG: DUF368 domain-containing protein [Lachnospiraceae bacterium]|nr:DUF368 domain-containing protein [Lachnospiraceae bacterium]
MNTVKTLLRGLFIGSTMTVPGVSGGTMAVVIGIYEELIHSLNGLLSYPKKHLPFLIKFVAGSVLSLLPSEGITHLVPDILIAGTGFIAMFLLSGKTDS